MNHAGFPSHLDSCSGCPSDGWPDNGRHYQIAILHQLERGDPWRLEGGGGGCRKKIEGLDNNYEDEDRRRRDVARTGKGRDGGRTVPQH